MKENVGFCDFQDRFRTMDRNENFSYEGKKALFEYLEQYEEDCNTEIELDVIALCCEYTEYKDIDEFLREYSNTIKAERKDFDTEEEYKTAVMEELPNYTTVIEISERLNPKTLNYEKSEAFIIQCF